ncbi:MAG: Fic family protein [Patescibacteria group bacterium]|nr:Fic family protein [Patescibacteria group bacterium]
MLIPPKYILTAKISQFLQSIEASKEVINSVDIPPELEINIRRNSTLKSSLFSARIEGNPLTMKEIQINPSKSQKKAEVFNILKALNWIHQKKYKDLNIKDILELHKMVMEGLTDKQDSGKFRTGLEAIFNSAGIAIYLPPKPSQILPLTQRLLKFANSPKEQFTPVRACLAHFIFEKIHPFLDGNGRVGRLLLQAVLVKGNYGMKGLVALEEYLDNHRSEYYQVLNEPEKDVTDYLEFMLEAIAETAENAKKLVLEKQKVDIEDLLLPRRAEILNIIKDHKSVSFDIIRRRFVAINERTLRYDLKKLQDQDLIKKRGNTKGVYYEIALKEPALQG